MPQPLYKPKQTTAKVDNSNINFDTIVIGGGLAGLSCAALLGKAGRSVLLLEKNRRLGGYAVSYTFKNHRFDIAVQAVGDCDEQGVVYQLLLDLGLEKHLKFLPCEPARVYFFADSHTPWCQPGSLTALSNDLCRRFPDQKKTIEKCYGIWSGILSELQGMAAMESNTAAFGFLKSSPLLARYSGYTVKQFLDEESVPENLANLLLARSGYCMLPPERLSLVGFACTEMTFSRGAWMVEGGIERFPKALAAAVEKYGGTIRLNSRATGLVTKKGQIKGVETKNGKIFKAENVVLASSLHPWFENRTRGSDPVPARYYQRLKQMEATASYYISYYSIGQNTARGLFPNIEVRAKNVTPAGDGSTQAWYMMIPSLVDSTAAPVGSHCLCLSVPCRSGRRLGVDGRFKCRRFLEQSATDRFPQLKGNLTFLFDLAPEHLELLSGNPAGSAYGWAQTPEQSGIRRLNIKTPIQGLYLTGHWTMPGGGIAGVVISGRICADTILRN